MSSYYQRRVALSDELCPYLVKSVETKFAGFETGGSLLTPEAKPITPSSRPDTMALVISLNLKRADGEGRLVALVFQEGEAGHPMVSILTNPESARHVVEVVDEDVSAAVAHLKSLIDETLQELAA